MAATIALRRKAFDVWNEATRNGISRFCSMRRSVGGVFHGEQFARIVSRSPLPQGIGMPRNRRTRASVRVVVAPHRCTTSSRHERPAQSFDAEREQVPAIRARARGQTGSQFILAKPRDPVLKDANRLSVLQNRHRLDTSTPPPRHRGLRRYPMFQTSFSSPSSLVAMPNVAVFRVKHAYDRD